jgi:hypothetical protein
VRSASSFRRSAGLLAATTVAFSTTVLLGPGTAQAAVPTWDAAGDGPTAPVPAGICAIEWTVIGGGAGADSEGTPGDGAGVLHADIPAAEGEIYTLHLGGAGTDAGLGTLNPGVGGTRADGDVLLEGQDGTADTEVAGGGGGAASTVELDDEVILQAYGADAYGEHGGIGGGTESFSVGATWYEDSIDVTGDPGDIYGEGIPCKPATPDLGMVEGLDGALRLHFSDGLDGDTETTGYEYTKDGGVTWTALTGVEDDFGLLTAVISGLTNGTEYTVSIRAIDADADTPPSYESEELTGTPYKEATAPGNVQVVAADGTITLSWEPSTAGTFPIAGYAVGIAWTNPGGQSGGGGPFCESSATVFTCSAPAQPGLAHDLQLFAVDTEGNPGEDVAVTSDVVPAPDTVPESDGELKLPAGAKASVAAGKTITVSGDGYMPNSTITVLLYSTPQILTTTVTDGNGAFTVTVTVPAGLAVGQHTLVAAGLDPNGEMRYVTLPITVTAGGAMLANTGADVTAPAIGGLAAVLVGAGLLTVARRRPESVPATAGTDLTD